MINNENYKKIKEMISKMGISEEHVSPDAHLYNDLGIDSTEMVEIAFMLEKNFGVTVNSAKLKDLTVNELVRMIE